MMAERVRARAAELPHAAEIADMALGAAGPVDRAELRRLAGTAVDQAEQLAFLLGRLATLLDDEPPEAPHASE